MATGAILDGKVVSGIDRYDNPIYYKTRDLMIVGGAIALLGWIVEIFPSADEAKETHASVKRDRRNVRACDWDVALWRGEDEGFVLSVKGTF